MMFAVGHGRTVERCGSSGQSIRAKFEYFRSGRPRSDREYLTVAKLTAGVASLLMIAGAIVICYIPKESVNDFSLIIGSLFGGGVLSIFLLGFFTTRVGYGAALFWPNRRELNHLTVWTMERKSGRSPRLIPDAVKEP
jgi:hypothetical protein